MSSKTKLRPYQEKGVRWIEHFNGRVILADQMRLGKTIQILWWWIKKHPEIRPVVTICPSIAKWVWEEQAKHHVNINSTVLESQTAAKHTPLTPSPLYIINYEILQYWVDFLKGIKPKLVIIDECHYIKNPRTKCSKVTRRLARGVKHIAALGGTPLRSKPSEMFNILNLVRPDIFDNIWTYRWRYCEPVRKHWGWEFNGAANLDELHHKAKTYCMIRRLRRDVINQLPNEERQVVPLDIKMKEYQQAENDFIGWLSKKSLTKAAKASKAERIVQMGYLRRLAAKSKMKQAYKWINNFLEESESEKLGVFGIHKSILRPLYEKYKGMSVIVDGSVTGRKRKMSVDMFQQKKKYRLFIGNIKAAGTAIELSKASAMVFVELEWTPDAITQVEDRAFEYGSKNPLMTYFLVAKNTIEEHLCHILQSKQNTTSAILDGDKNKNTLNVFTQLEKALKRKGRKK